MNVIADLYSIMIQVVIALLWILSLAQAYCSNPQKAIFLSLQALSNRGNMQFFFRSFPTSTFEFAQSSKDQRNYVISRVRYQLIYNNRFHKETVINSTTMRTTLGIVDIMAQFDYDIIGGDLPIKSGHGAARTHLDPSQFDKILSHKQGFIAWDPINVDNLTLRVGWKVQIPYFVLNQSDVLNIQAIFNNQLGKNNFSSNIQTQINTYYQSRLKLYLNSEHLISDNSFVYNYGELFFNITHHALTASLIDHVGLVAYIVFGTNKTQQTCPQLPSSFDIHFGGVQEIITITTIRSFIREAANDGLFTVQLDNTWDVSLFQFYMGDLASAAAFASTLRALQPLKVSCQCSDTSRVNVYPFNQKSLFVQLPYKCEVGYQQEKLMSIETQLVYIASLVAESTSLQVQPTQIQTRKLTFTPYDRRFQVTNNQVANMIVNAVLEQLLNIDTFGSGFPIISRNYPSLFIKEDVLVIFDPSEPI